MSSKFGWKTKSSLTLDAYESIIVNAPVSVKKATSVNLDTDDGGTGGALTFGPKGQIEFGNCSCGLNINGEPFKLVHSVSALASAIAKKPSGNFALGADYDASADGTYLGSPIPTEIGGAIQGLGNSISNLSARYVNRKGQVSGVFEETRDQGSIEGLRIINERVRVTNSAEWGGLVGRNYGILFNDFVNGVFFAKGANAVAAGLAAANYNQILYSAATVKMLGDAGYVAGLVAENVGEIVGCHANGSISAQKGGGLVLYNDNIIDQSYSAVKVKGDAGAILGGLIGYEDGITTNSYATGSVSGDRGSVLGGFVGETTAQTYTSYSTGAVSGGSSSLVGGFAGDDSAATISESYWDTTSSGLDDGTGQGNVSGLTGLTTAQLQSGLPAGFDSAIWSEDPNINNGLPYLINNPPEKK